MKEWLVTYILKGIPDEQLVKASHYIFCRPGDAPYAALQDTKKYFLGLQKFLVGITKPEQLAFAVFQVYATSMTEAFKQSRPICHAIVDIYGIASEITVPEVAPIALFREDREAGLRVGFISDSGIAHSDNQQGEGKAADKKYCLHLLGELMPVLELIGSPGSAKSATDLEKQIFFSSSAFRRSHTPDFLGLEFAGKFSALESLVTGATRNKKGEKLVGRLSQLFRHENEIEKTVSELWKIRNSALHEARFLYFDSVDDGQFPALHLGTLHYLFVGTLTFAMEHRSTAATIPALWEKVKDYELPSWAKTPHPQHQRRSFVTSMVGNMGLEWTNMGTATDDAFPLNPSSEPAAGID